MNIPLPTTSGTQPLLARNSSYRDNTMLSCYKDCPQKFYLRHKRDWRREGTGLALVFGSSWHVAMDVVWTFAKQVPHAELRDLAYAAFMEEWIAGGLPAELTIEQLDQFKTRTPGIAREMLHNYILDRWKILQNCELLACEQPFAVPLPGTNTWYIGRLDKVIKLNGEKLIVEHKTTAIYQKDGGFQHNYLMSWHNDSQVKGYQFAGSLYFPGLSQVWVDAALAHKTVHDAFRFIPIQHNFEMLREWTRDTAEWVARVEGDLAKDNFPKNENNCMGKYGACSYLDICRTTAQPSTLTEPPEGFIVEKWEPFDILKLDELIQGPQNATV